MRNLDIKWDFINRLSPLSNVYGLDRGQAIDRFYIESFLQQHGADIHGHCLEVLSRDYTNRFGQASQSDVIDIDSGNKQATIVGDLRKAACIADNTYDCFICTQTLHVIDDLSACIRETHRFLKPGGVLLATIPCFSRLDVAAGRDHDFWRLTPAGARFVFNKVFGAENVAVVSYGNVKTGVGFWVGMAQEDLEPSDLTYHDPDFPVLVGVRAVKEPVKPAAMRSRQSPVYSATKATCTVLLYHRVGCLPNDPNLLAVPPDLFRKHLSFLSRRYEVLSPAAFSKCLQRQAWPSQESVLITFDDGYRDNLESAAPLLQHDGIGAWFFIAGGRIGTTTPFWWDDLEHIVFNGRGELTLSGGLLHDDVRLKLDSEADRRSGYDLLVSRLKQMNTERRNKALQALREQSGVAQAILPHQQILSESDVRALAAIPGMEIGGHTLSHTVLARLTLHEQYREIKQDRDRLAGLLGSAPRAISYPNGVPEDQGDETYDLACAAGYRMGFINDGRRFHGANRLGMEVSRVCVQNWSIVALRDRLDTVANLPPIPEPTYPPETQLLEAAVTLALTSLVKDGVRSIALFGAGKHTVWLVALIERLQAMRIVVIVDQQAVSGGEFMGYRLEPESSLASIPVDAVVVSSDTYADRLCAQAKQLWPNLKIVNLYSIIPRGAYRKRSARHIRQG